MENTNSNNQVHHILQLPEDILYQILLKLPLKSLVLSHCVCKSWYTLIAQNPEFQLLCFRNLNSDNPRRLIGFKPRKNYQLNLSTTNDFRVFDESFTRNEPLPCNLPLEHEKEDEDEDEDGIWFTQIIGSSNGVLCLYHPNELNCNRTKVENYINAYKKWKVDNYLMFLWNPSIRKYRRVDYPWKEVPPRFKYSIIGFGYVSNTIDHKIVVVTKDVNDEDHVYVYSLRMSCWREIGAELENWGRTAMEDEPGTYFNGACHWVVYTNPRSKEVISWDSSFWSRKESTSSDSYRIMLCFDMEREEFYYMDLEPMQQLADDNTCHRRFRTLVYNNMLAVCDNLPIMTRDTCVGIKLWCMKEYRNADSWTLLYHVETTDGLLFKNLLYGTFDLEKDDEPLPEQDLIWSYDPHDQQHKPLPIKTGILNQLVPYQESLFLL